MNRYQILDAFRFLANRGFVEGEARPDLQWNGMQVSFTGPQLRIDASYNDRDSFGCDVWFLSHAGTTVSVGTLVAALKRDEATRAGSSLDALREQAAFVRRHLEQLLGLPADVLDDCRALRFYHAGPWRKDWGRAIQMDAETISAERRRLERLRNYFSADQQAA